MNKGLRTLITIDSVIVGVASIVAALIYVNHPSLPIETNEMTRETLSNFDGRNGNPCYVAVDGIVYAIDDKPLWVEGEHLPSHGQAMCGQDLSVIIDLSPHGRSKLQILPVVGHLVS